MLSSKALAPFKVFMYAEMVPAPLKLSVQITSLSKLDHVIMLTELYQLIFTLWMTFRMTGCRKKIQYARVLEIRNKEPT